MTPAPPEPAATPADDGAGPAVVRLGPRVHVREADLRWAFVRGGGPGGQNVNKVATTAELRVAVAAIVGLRETAAARLRSLAGSRLVGDDEILLVASEHRSQKMNRDACLERFADLVRRAMVEPKRRKKTKPSRGSVQRRLDEKKRRGEIKRRRSGGD